MNKPQSGKASPAPSRRSKWPLLLGMTAALAAAAAVASAGTVWALKRGHAGNDGDDVTVTKQGEESPKPLAAPVFVPLEGFTVKLLPDVAGQIKYLRLVPALKALDLPASEKIKAYLPQIRHDILRVMAVKQATDISTPQGIEQLAIELRNRINAPLREGRRPLSARDKAASDDPVQAVLFSTLLVS